MTFLLQQTLIYTVPLLIVALANIPTAILLVIYFTGRKEPRMKKQMKKKNSML